MIMVSRERAVITRLTGALHLGQTFTILQSQSSPTFSMILQQLRGEMYLINTII